MVVFILLLVFGLLLLGFACACLSDHPIQVIERVLAAIPAAPAIVLVWSPMAVAALAVGFFGVAISDVRARPSPALLQRFLF